MSAMSVNENTIIPFDSGRSYVVRSFPPTAQEKYRFVDSMGRTDEEKRFLDLFVKIFYAAGGGDLKKCQDIIEEEKFNDIDAFSIGRFSDQRSNKALDYISPRRIAQINGHINILEYFSNQFGHSHQGSKNVVEKSGFNLESISEEDKRLYESYKNSYKEFFLSKEISPDDVLQDIRAQIMNTYSIEESIEKVDSLKEMTLTDLCRCVAMRCEEKFTSDFPYKKEKRLKLYAMRDTLQEVFPQKNKRQESSFSLESLSESEKTLYQYYLSGYNKDYWSAEESLSDVLDSIRLKIANTYSFEELSQKFDFLKTLDVIELLQTLWIRCEEEFSSNPPSDKATRLELYAIRDCLWRSFELHKKGYKELFSSEKIPIVLKSICAIIVDTYSFEDEKRSETSDSLKNMDANELLQFIYKRCEEEFSSDPSYDKDKRLELYAIQDCLEDFLDRQ
jgi:hypothetical protein